MIPEIEKHIISKREVLEKNGIKVVVKKSEIRPALFKLSVTMETSENAATFTVWNKDTKAPVEADVIVLNIPTRRTTVSKSFQPGHVQELIDAFEELTGLLK